MQLTASFIYEVEIPNQLYFSQGAKSTHQLCLSGVLPDGVWSEWGYAQWGFVRLPPSVTSSMEVI